MDQSLVGKEAPDFKLKDQDGKEVSLRQFRGKKVVLYFYPKDFSPGCTKEACSFRDNDSVLREKGAVVLGVSLDDSASHKSFRESQGLKFPLLADPTAETSKKYGVYKLRNLGGKEFMGIERSTFIIDENGKVVKEFRAVNVDAHMPEVLKAVS